MSIRFFMLFTLLLMGLNLTGQENNGNKNKEEEEDKNTFSENLFFGGSLWASFGAITQVEVAPVLGYHINPRFDVGMGAKYIYYNTSTWQQNAISDVTGTSSDVRFSAHIFGGNVFTRYAVINDLNKILPFNFDGRLTAHIEYEGLNIPAGFDQDKEGGRFWAHNYWVGGGLQQRMGKKAYLNIFILYNLNGQVYSIYDNPIIRIGVNF